jgi:CheY-like chemotaxis protein
MPGEDGHQFLKKLRALPRNRGGRTPAIALTAFGTRDARLKSVYAGYHYHLTKPVDADKLVDILVGLVRLTRTQT